MLDFSSILGGIAGMQKKDGSSLMSLKGQENMNLIGSGLNTALSGFIQSRNPNLDKGVQNQLAASGLAEAGISTGLKFIPGVGQIASGLFDGASAMIKSFRKPEQMENDTDVAQSSGFQGLTQDTDRLNQNSAASAGGLFGYRSKQRKYKKEMDKLKAQQQEAAGILSEGKRDMQMGQNNAQSLMTANRLTQGGFDPSALRIGKKGMKIIAERVNNKLIKDRLEEKNKYKLESIVDAWDILPDDILDYIENLVNSGENPDTDESIVQIKDLIIARNGAKISMLDIKNHLETTPKFKLGGAINVILNGKLHEERHSLKDIDKFKDVRLSEHGIPLIANVIEEKGETIFAKDGGKIEQLAEFERDEIVFRRSVTKEIEDAVEAYQKNKSKDIAIKLGKKLVFEILENTEDSDSNLLKK